MERVTISLDDALLGEFDAFIARKGYENRSEAIRDLLRERLEHDRLEEGRAEHAVGCLAYVFNHNQRELGRRLTQAQHAHHGLMLSTLHIHLDHENCLEVSILQGPTGEVRRFADATMAETGVRHGNLHLVPATMDSSEHHHGEDGGHAHTHTHIKPTS